MDGEAASGFGSADIRLGDSLKVLDRIPNGSVKLAISSPPYNIGKSYEKEQLSFEDYVVFHTSIAEKIARKVSSDGSLCWQVGNHIKEGEVFPLDFTFYDIFHKLGLKLKNRIIWKFNFGLNADKRFSGRYETVLWFSKGSNPTFNLDPVRVPQLYPGKRHAKSKGAKAGLPSGNPKGKSPGDYWEFDAARHFAEENIWDIPNVKAKHPEKTDHTCQFPLELAERCILALTNEGDTVLDPFVGVGTSVVAAIKHGRRGIGIEKEQDFVDIARARAKALKTGVLPMREFGKPVRRPRNGERVAQVPDEWLVYPPVEKIDESLNGTALAEETRKAEKAKEGAAIGS